jgi:hypothetical protein
VSIARRGILICVFDYADTPEELALKGFRPDDQATIVNVEYRQYSSDLLAVHGDLGHAVVQVGFAGKSAYYYIPAYHYRGGWRLEMPPEGDPRRRIGRTD